jgi:tRNA (adenine22-N1)-methyltransferase
MTDIKLSRRMQAVADMVAAGCCVDVGDSVSSCGCTVADIGCDHAFVSIYLKSKGIAGKVIAMDVRKGPLDIARSNIASYGLSEYIDVRLSDGFAALAPGEADIAVIAGMGGLLMVDILKRGSVHTECGIELVLQPQSEPDKLRLYLDEIGYDIVDEVFLMEDGKYYTVIRAVKLCRDSDAACDEAVSLNDVEIKAQLIYGPVLLKKKDRLLRKYIEGQLEKNHELRDRLGASPTPKSASRIEELKKEEEIMLWALREQR